MKTHKLYKDGNIDKFRNYPKAIFIASMVSFIVFIVPVGFLGQIILEIPYANYNGHRKSEIVAQFLHNLFQFFKDFENRSFLKTIILMSTGIVFINVIYILKKPMIMVKYPFIFFYGNSPFASKFKIPELKSVSITSDPYSLNFIVKHIGLTETIEVKGVDYLKGSAEAFIQKHTHIVPI